MVFNMSDTKLTARDDFNPVYVLTLVQENNLSMVEAMRIIEEACHVIVRQHEQIEAWEKAAPWRAK
jgi:predicted metallopeptidase